MTNVNDMPLEPVVPLLDPQSPPASTTGTPSPYAESRRLMSMLKNSGQVHAGGGSPLRPFAQWSPAHSSVASTPGRHTDGMAMLNHVLNATPKPRGYYYPNLSQQFSPMTAIDVNASNDLMRILQPNKAPKSVPFIPHNAYSIDPITGGMVAPIARDIIPQGLPINRIPAGMWTCIQQSSNLQMHVADDEEAHGLSGFDRVLYTRSELARRVACEEYNYSCKQKGYDLTLSMPVQVPYGNIVVDVNSGEHYYGIMGENASPSHPHSAHILFGRGLKAEKTMSFRDPPEGVEDVPDFTASNHPSACDVWSSFLRIKLGVIYNVRQDQFKIVTESLKSIMGGITFDRPLEFTANGIYANGPQGILQAPPQYHRGVKYVTHLKPKTAHDQERFIIIRQRIKCFANALGFHFGGSLGGVNYNGSSLEYQPLICVELDTNLSSERIKNGLISVELRSYNSEDIANELKDSVWSRMDDTAAFKNKTKDTIVSKVEATEIRLEHDRGHCVDPRWPKDLIIARRITSHDSSPTASKDTPSTERYARHVFCNFPSPQNVLYRGKFRDLREGEKKEVVTEKKLDGQIVKEKLCQSRFKREFASYLRAEPHAGTSSPKAQPVSPVNAPLPKPYTPVMTPPISAPFVAHGQHWNVNATEFRPTAYQNRKKHNGNKARRAVNKNSKKQSKEDGPPATANRQVVATQQA